jgi:glycolate oxidase FAD binding subunit
MDTIVQQLADTLREASAHETPLRIRGGGTKDFYGNPATGETLSTNAYRGIIDYEPTELVVTARAGTPLTEVEAALREKGQMLAFEPPYFGQNSTLGGCIAAGLSGPRRAYAGAVRDLLLGVRMLDGKGADLRFGGQVMKNVAGFDVSRLMAGSMGTLGVILEVSLKTLPLSAIEATLSLHGDEATAIKWFNEWAGKPLPISATAWRAGDIGVRLSGARAAVNAAMQKIGGTLVAPEQAERFWHGIRDQTDPFFAGATPLWRLSIKSTTPPLALPSEQLIEWSGALRWLKSDLPAATVREAASRAGGHATLFRAADKSAGAFHPLSPALAAIHRNLKQTFDPAGILNRGRIYSEF